MLRSASNWLTQKKALENVFDGFRKPIENVLYLLDSDQKYELGTDARTDNMYFVGRQDIEDALPNALWSTLASSVYPGSVQLTVDDIEEIKQSIPNDVKAKDKNSKFIPLVNKRLITLAKEKGIETYASLPTKGKELAEKILEELKSKDDIPDQIKECFEALNPKVPIHQIHLSKEEVYEAMMAEAPISNN